MTKEFCDYQFGKIKNVYKVSANFREKTLRIWIYDIKERRYYRHLKASFISIAEIDEVMYDMTFNDFRQFLQIDIFTIWR